LKHDQICSDTIDVGIQEGSQKKWRKALREFYTGNLDKRNRERGVWGRRSFREKR